MSNLKTSFAKHQALPPRVKHRTEAEVRELVRRTPREALEHLVMEAYAYPFVPENLANLIETRLVEARPGSF